MSLSRTFWSTASDSDYEDDCFYLIRKSHGDYRDEPFCYDGISDEELHHRLNIEFGEKVNWERYDIGFCEEDINLLQRNISNLNHGLCSTQWLKFLKGKNRLIKSINSC